MSQSANISALYDIVEDSLNSLETPNTAGAAGDLTTWSLESGDAIGEAAEYITAATESFSTSLVAGLTTHEDRFDETTSLSEAQLRAGSLAQLLTHNPVAALEHVVPEPTASKDVNRVINGVVGGIPARADLSSYDERKNDSLATHTVTYNIASVDTGAFIKAFFPIVVIDPGDSGLSVPVLLRFIQPDLARELNGDVTDFRRRSLFGATIDSSILKDDATRVIPYFNNNNADKFVDPAVIAPWTRLNQSVAVTTNYLKFGTEMDLISLSQTALLLSRGYMTAQDQLDTKVTISNIAVKIGNDIIDFDIGAISSANFQGGGIGYETTMTLVFNSSNIKLDNQSTARNGVAFTEASLVAIGVNDLTVQISLVLNGTCDTDSGKLVVYPSAIKIHRVHDNTNTQLPMSDPLVADLSNDFANIEFLGFVPYAHRSNLNHRQLGPLLTRTVFRTHYYVPIRSPHSVKRPTSGGSAKLTTGAQDINDLVAMTHLDMRNEAVTKILDAAATLHRHTTATNVEQDNPDYLGISGLAVQPRYIRRHIDMPLQLNSPFSHQRALDTYSVLTMQIRDMAATLYIDSSLGEVRRLVDPTNTTKTVVTICCDSYVATYLFHPDSGLFGKGDNNDSTGVGTQFMNDIFDYRIVVNNNLEMRNKIVMMLGEAPKDNKFNWLGTGNTLYCPEIVADLVVDRSGQTSREITVSRHYLMVVNTVVMGVIDVEGLTESLGAMCNCLGTSPQEESNTNGLNSANGTGGGGTFHW